MKKIALFFLILLFETFSNSEVISQPFQLLENLQSEISDLITTAKHSIVTVSSQSTNSYLINKTEGIKSIFWDDHEEKKKDLWVVGSGIIYNEDGYIITKSSMLAGFEKIKVTLFNKKDYEAQYIGTDEITGLAILKIDADDLIPVKLGNSNIVSLYSLTMVLGNSMGISPYASFGIINGKTNQGQFIISAPLNPGSTGAGLFNLSGELIGIISAQLDSDSWMTATTYSGNPQQNGIALTSNMVSKITDKIMLMQHEKKGWLGVDLNADSLSKGKIVIKNVIPNSPAYRSGLKIGDWLLKYNDSILRSSHQFASLLENTKPGKTVSIDFIRDNRPLKIFPQIAYKKPGGFNTNKPTKATSQIPGLHSQFRDQQSILLSPERLNNLNYRIEQLENEIKKLKSQIKEHQQ